MQLYTCSKDYYLNSILDGVESTQLECFPEYASYKTRDFTWRVSIDKFTSNTKLRKLAGYRESILSLEGSADVIHKGEGRIHLEGYKLDFYDENAEIEINTEQLSVFRVMTKMENDCEVDTIDLTKAWQKCRRHADVDWQCKTVVLYCISGHAEISTPKALEEIREGEMIVLEYKDEDQFRYSVKGTGTLARATILFGDSFEVEPDPYDVKVVSEKGTFQDFLTCIYLANVKTALARYISPKARNQWLAPPLSKITRQLDNIRFSGIIICVIGIIIILLTRNGNQATLATLIWFIVDILVTCLVITPLIYYISVPKPVSKYIKDINSLTKEERAIMEYEARKELEEATKKKKRNQDRIFRH